MALRKRRKYRFGDSQADIRAELRRYSKGITYLTHHFADAVCPFGNSTACYGDWKNEYNGYQELLRLV